MRTRDGFLPIVFILAFTGASSVTPGDRAFVRAALKSGVAEVQRAAAEANSADYRVRQYAGRGAMPLSTVAYFREEVRTHQQAIALFSREASGTRDSKLRAFAQHTLPVLKEHLRLAQTYLKQGQQLDH